MSEIKQLNEQIQQFLEQEYIECNKKPLHEFADFTPEDTNLVAVIWVDGPRNLKHGKRIKFQNSTANRLNGGELIPVTIADDPQIPSSVKNRLNIKEKELTRIKQWIILNKQTLEDYANGVITTKKLFQLIKPLED